MSRRSRGVWRRESPWLYAVVGVIVFVIACALLQRHGDRDAGHTPDAGGTAIAAAEKLPVASGRYVTGYSRDEFGRAWADVDGNGCDTRNDILARDLTRISLASDGCTVLSGILADPYTGATIAFRRGASTSAAVQIDHVVALLDAWRSGASAWTATQRLHFANDPLNLLASDGPTNQAKGSSDASGWLPPNASYRCPYVARQVAVKTEYRLSVTPDERDAMLRVLRTCPAQHLP